MSEQQNEVIETGFSLTPRNLDEAMRMADIMAQSEMVPRDYQGKPGNVLVAVQMGLEIGFKPVQSLQNIAVINGRPALWGDGLRALVLSAPDLIELTDTLDQETMTAKCVIVRNKNGGKLKSVGEFSQQDAEVAGLWGKNTWNTYPKKMLEWRALGFAARKAYADRLKGIQLAEEVRDIQPEREIAGETVREFYLQTDFEKNFSVWEQTILAGRRTAEEVIAAVELKAPLTEEMKQKILDVKAPEAA